MQIPPLTRQEQTLLQKLESDGPLPMIAPQIRGVLALYALIDETPHGWTITPLGKDALRKPSLKSPLRAAANDPWPDRLAPRRRVHQRTSPF